MSLPSAFYQREYALYLTANLSAVSAMLLALAVYTYIEKHLLHTQTMWGFLVYWTLDYLGSIARLVLVHKHTSSLHIVQASLLIPLSLFQLVVDIAVLCKKDLGVTHRKLKATMRYRPHCVPLLSGVTFSWMTGLLSLGHKKLLHMEDLGELPQSETTEEYFHLLQEQLKREKKKKKLTVMGLWLCFLRASLPYLLLSGICKLMIDAFILVSPLCLSSIVDYVAREQTKRSANYTQNEVSNGHVL